jgi:hypothetical protein
VTQHTTHLLLAAAALMSSVACGTDTLGTRGALGEGSFLDRDTGEPCTPEASSLSNSQALGDNSDDESSDQIDCREDGNSGAGDDRAGCNPDGTDLTDGTASDDGSDDGSDGNGGSDDPQGGGGGADDEYALSDNCDALGCCEVL